MLPPGVVNVITGDGVPVGDGLVRHPDVALVSLTGDVETGKVIARNASDTLKRVHLELGGKAPMVVLDDADPQAVAAGVKIGGYFNSGQDCTASSRILVAEGIYDDVMAETVGAVESLKVGDPSEVDDVEMGPVISAAQQERVIGFLERAVAAKADGRDGRRHGRRPGLLRRPDDRRRRDPGRRDRAARGVRAGRDRAALRLRRGGARAGERRPLRLAASVFSRDVGRALAAARKLAFGTVWINEHLFPLTPEMPHGGFKQSGYGKDMSVYSMEEYTRVKHVVASLT